ncbi:hypothetical protein HPB49_021245 [Dermacentor silvarum]|uniref:Uncharacterized protein n=1 Tax=Dermacentor silvarum TaxID=543639 RepID=A0ACB8CHH6_DERSI|nr:hypothetical protein HPB49_021245 [Dermacentor silvarum]
MSIERGWDSCQWVTSHDGVEIRHQPPRGAVILSKSPDTILLDRNSHGESSSNTFVIVLISVILIFGTALVVLFLVLGGDPPPNEFICTVGAFALFDNMYPPDGLCNYLFYAHALVSNGSVLAVEVDASWQQFKAHVKTYTMTQGGISFDARYIQPQAFDNQNTKNALNNLAAHNIMHYGILNIVRRLKDFDTYVDKAKQAIQKLKAIQGTDASRRLIMAIGLHDYNEPNAWERYRAAFRTAVEKTMADTVIAISSTGWIENEQNCYSAPTSVLDSMRLQDPARTIAKSYPDLKTHAALVAANVMYNKNTTRLGLSLEMGTLLYVLNATEMNIKKKSYRPCKQFYLTQADTVDCQGLTDSELLAGGMRYGSPLTAANMVLSWEDEDSLQEKLNGLKTSINLRPGLSWLLYDVHLGDLSSRCSTDAFERVQLVKDNLVP